MGFLKYLFLIYLAVPCFYCSMWDLVPWTGIEPGPPLWELRVLASVLPGKSLNILKLIQNILDRKVTISMVWSEGLMVAEPFAHNYSLLGSPWHLKLSSLFISLGSATKDLVKKRCHTEKAYVTHHRNRCWSSDEGSDTKSRSLEKTPMLGKIEGMRVVTKDMKWSQRSWSQQTWVWANSGRQWRTGQPDVLQFMGLQKSDTTEWTTTAPETLAPVLQLHCSGMEAVAPPKGAFTFRTKAKLRHQCWNSWKSVSQMEWTLRLSVWHQCRSLMWRHNIL